MNYLLLLIPIGLTVLFVRLTNSLLRQSKKDWATLHDLEQKANKVKTKDEIKTLHAELIEKSSKIFNKYVNARLGVVEGYLRGLYQQFKQDV